MPGVCVKQTAQAVCSKLLSSALALSRHCEPQSGEAIQKKGGVLPRFCRTFRYSCLALIRGISLKKSIRWRIYTYGQHGYCLIFCKKT
jgi:hypothetical protein